MIYKWKKKFLNVTTYLKKQFSNLNSVIRYCADDLTEEEWATRPGPGQNRIGYTVWHIARAQDHFLHSWIRGTNEIFHRDRWAKWHSLRPLGMGVGITLAESDEIAFSVQLADVLAYADEVHQALVAWLTEIDEEELDRVPNAQEYLAAFPEYQTPGYLEEVNNLFGLPVWGLLIRPSMGHIQRHWGGLEITKDILRKASVAVSEVLRGIVMDYDVIIVGGRLAGSILATRLGRSGFRVLLLEKASFPSDTLSTSFFRAPALRIFEKVGVLEEIKSAAPPLRILWNNIDGHVIREPVDAAEEHLRFFLCERRITLDQILFQRVKREPGVEVRLGANVRDLIWRDGRVIGVQWSEPDGMGEATARAVIGADGFYSRVAKILNPVYETFSSVQRCIYYTYFQGLDSLEEPTAEHHFAGNTLTYVFPTDANLTMVALSLPFSEFNSFRKEPLKRLQAHLESLPLLGPRLARAEVATEIYGSGNIPCYQRIPFGPGWALVGDAHQVMDPWSGMGIDHATTHADFLADSLYRWLKEESTWETAMNEYRRQARRWSEKSYRRTSTYAADLRPMTRAALQRRGLLQAVGTTNQS